MVSRKINLCFVFPEEKSWTGGLNYYVALISSLTSLKKKKFNFIIFCSSKNKIYLSRFINKKNIVASNFFDNKSIFGFFRRLLKIIFKVDVILNFFIKINNINVISHHDPNKKIASICWIPDLQHKFLKYLSLKKEIKKKENLFKNYIKNATCIIVSSQDAYNNLVKYFKNQKKKYRILRFVPKIDFKLIKKLNFLEMKYKLNKKFIYIPNQFWKHKNHSILIKCAMLLKKKNYYVQFVISGNPSNGQNNEVFNNFVNNINKYQLNNYFNLLGFIPYSEVINLIYHSQILINPSLFEGWSTSVEEAKIFKKKMILSNLNVHKEQCQNNALYFHPKDHLELSKNIIKLLELKKNYYSIKKIKKNYEKSRILFAKKYLKIVESVL
jgi:hypothetical protein